MNRLTKLLFVCLLLLFAVCLAACNGEIGNENGTTNTTATDTDTPTEGNTTLPPENNDPTPPEEIEGFPNGEAYLLTYASNGNGTCRVTAIKTNPDYQGDIDIVIPEAAPNGERVVGVTCGPFSNGIPRIIAAEDFEKIVATLEAKVESGELAEFFCKKFQAFFTKHALSEFPEQHKETILTTYPLTAITDIYVYATDTNAEEDKWIKEYLYGYGEYTHDRFIADLQHLRELVQQSDAANKDALLSLVPTPYSGETVSSLSVPKDVEQIDLALYRSCPKLTELILPVGITDIPRYAYYGNTNLKKLVMYGGTSIDERAFYGCTNLSEVTLHAGTLCGILSEECFGGCTALKSIVIPASVHTISDRAFAESGLETVVLSEGITTISYSAFSDCRLTYNQKNGVNYLGTATNPYYAAMGLADNELQTLTPENGCTVIAGRAFLSCDTITELVMPDTLQFIGEAAFSSCTNLTSITFSPNTKHIEQQAFSGCESLQSVTLPKSLSFLGESVFWICPKLSLSVDPENRFFYVDNGSLYKEYTSNLGHQKILIWVSPTHEGEFTVPNGVTKIETHAFDACNKITKVVLPEGITKLYGFTFDECEALTEIVIPASVTEIETDFFYVCQNLTKLTFTDTPSTWKMEQGGTVSYFDTSDIENAIECISRLSGTWVKVEDEN